MKECRRMNRKPCGISGGRCLSGNWYRWKRLRGIFCVSLEFPEDVVSPEMREEALKYYLEIYTPTPGPTATPTSTPTITPHNGPLRQNASTKCTDRRSEVNLLAHLLSQISRVVKWKEWIECHLPGIPIGIGEVGMVASQNAFCGGLRMVTPFDFKSEMISSTSRSESRVLSECHPASRSAMGNGRASASASRGLKTAQLPV